jgi:hypothetical protein
MPLTLGAAFGGGSGWTDSALWYEKSTSSVLYKSDTSDVQTFCLNCNNAEAYLQIRKALKESHRQKCLPVFDDKTQHLLSGDSISNHHLGRKAEYGIRPHQEKKLSLR